MSQPYYKAADVQNYLIPDPKALNQFPAIPHNYYAANMQKSHFPAVYSSAEAQPKIAGQIFTPSSLNLSPSSSQILNPGGKLTQILSTPNESKYSEKEYQHRLPYTETLVETKAVSKLPKALKTLTNEEKYVDEYSNFDFTVEAEKMVSALCNTSVQEDREEDEKDKDQEKNKLLNENENESEKKIYKPWYLEDYEEDRTKSIGTQTLDPTEESTYRESLRKTVNWGCNQAEIILKSSESSREKWLASLSTATKTALAKSSTCFPVFSGDKVFSQDLINSLLRISNGWLILDHYLNKQHHANLNLNDKYDSDLLKSFKNWEIFTRELLDNVIKTFTKLDASSKNESLPTNSSIHSFPGDVSLYITQGLFGDTSTQNSSTNTSVKSGRSLFRNSLADNEQKEKSSNVNYARESKLRTRWTITEQTHSNDINLNCLQKYENSDWNLFPKEIPKQITSVNNEVRQKLHYNFLITPQETSEVPAQYFQFKQMYESQPCVQSNSTNENRTFWNSCASPSPICNSLPYNASLNNRMTVLSSIETKHTEVKNLNEGETINLSTLFASIRNKRVNSDKSESSASWWKSSNAISSKFREEAAKNSKNSDAAALKNDINRQLRTLKNMRTIQSAPWTANHLLNDSPKSKQDNCEDLKVYMKPGSYNVPRKKFQNRRNRKDTSKSNGTQSKSSEDFGSKVVNSSSSSTCSQDISKDVAWKAACASAELLLDALIVRKSYKIEETDTVSEENKNGNSENVKVDGEFEDCDKAEGKELKKDLTDGSKKICGEKCKVNDDRSNEVLPGNHKTNVKTDSWLIRTLNNANESKHVEPKKSNSVEESDSVVLWKKDYKGENSVSVETSHTISVMALVDVVGKATYSETVRRFSSSKPCAQVPLNTKEDEKNSVCKSSNGGSGVTDGKKEPDVKKTSVAKQEALKARCDKVKNKKKINKKQSGNKSWSIWYNSRRNKQTCNTHGLFVIYALYWLH